MKQLIIAVLLFFAIIPSIKAQVSPVQGPPCPVDGKFEYKLDDYGCLLLHPDILAKIEEFTKANKNSLDCIKYVELFKEKFCKDDEYNWDRFQELWDLLLLDKNGNHHAIVENCEGIHPLSFWSDLINFYPSQDLWDKAKSKGYRPQYGYVPGLFFNLHNLDYYPMAIIKLPTSPALNADQLLNYVRTHLDEFTDLTKSDFTPIKGDEAIWNSSNPLGAILHIEIQGGLDNGSVMCTDYEPNYWVFTTVEDKFIGGDGYHPVSGNRMFGYTIENGKYIYFTKGSDNAWASISVISTLISYNGGAALWEDFQEKVCAFVNQHGGICSVETPDRRKPSEYLVVALLKGNIPITKIPCK